MKIIDKKVLSYFLGTFTLLLSIILYLFFIDKVGFADGYISEYQLAMKKYFQLTLIPLSLLGINFFILGHKIKRERKNKKMIISTFLFFSYLLITLIIAKYFYTILNYGQGG